jgi:hypothetical protein
MIEPSAALQLVKVNDFHGRLSLLRQHGDGALNVIVSAVSEVRTAPMTAFWTCSLACERRLF